MDREWTKWTAERNPDFFGRPLRPLSVHSSPLSTPSTRPSSFLAQNLGNKKMCRTRKVKFPHSKSFRIGRGSAYRCRKVADVIDAIAQHGEPLDAHAPGKA